MRRSMLFIPGNTPNLLMNGDVLGADSIILDLEDAVSPAEKDSARILVRNALKSLHYKGCEIIIRINPVETDYWTHDLDEIIPLKPNMIMPPKVSCAQDVKTVSEYITKLEEKCGFEKNTVKLIPLIETAMGVENAFQIASADERVAALFLGGEDLTADLRCKRTKEGNEIFYARTRLVCAARACGVDVYDTPLPMLTISTVCMQMLALRNLWASPARLRSLQDTLRASTKYSAQHRQRLIMHMKLWKPSALQKNRAKALFLCEAR